MTRLTEEMVIARSRGGGSDLASIKKLNCWGSDLSDVSIIKRMRGVEVLALSVNKIASLAPFEDCLNLQELYLRKNVIADINEIAYLQNLPSLKYLWLEENPCCDGLGVNYRSIVLRALPNLKKLDNIDVTPEEIEEAMRMTIQREDEVYEDAREVQQQQQQLQQQQQQQRRSQSPNKEQYPSSSPSEIITEENSIENIIQSPASSSPPPPSQPQVQRSPPNQDYSPQESIHPPSPKYNNNNNNINNNNNNNINRDNRMSYHQYDRSPGSEESSPYSGDRVGGGGGGGYKDRGPIPPSISTHSMKEYYQSDYQKPQQPSHYRHSQTDLTEWDEQQQQSPSQNGGSKSDAQTRRTGVNERDERYRNGNSRQEDWEDRDDRSRRGHGRFSDTASVVSTAVLNHYAGYHRRPVNRSSNLLSATLCLVKELDYPSLEVVEHAVRCRIDELSAD